MLEICIGNISSGKSTWCKKRAANGWIIINDDAIVNAVHGGQYILYDKSLKPLYKSIENHMLYTAIAMGKNVCIDRGVDMRASSRARWICVAKSLDIPIRAVSFEVFKPGIHAKRRTESDGRGHDFAYWLSVATSFDNQYVAPTIEEGFIFERLKAPTL